MKPLWKVLQIVLYIWALVEKDKPNHPARVSQSNFWCGRGSITCNVDCTCACVVACLCPHHYISNVVVSLVIHDYLYLKVYPVGTVQLMKVPGRVLVDSPHGKSASLTSLCHCVLKASSASAVSCVWLMPIFWTFHLFRCSLGVDIGSSLVPCSCSTRPIPNCDFGGVSLQLRSQWTRTFGLLGGSFEFDWLGELRGGWSGCRRWSIWIHL